MSLELRVMELETRLAFQDDTIQTLNDELVEQQRIIERLQMQISALAKRQEDMQSGFGMSEEEAPPPHY
ncbi:MAG: SlyX family protein [Pseudomonas sp.]|uniref:SlyX family protein n=1 Tax=Pseudomonas sp. TaxID=306 RepID=UPI0030F29FD1